MVLSNSSNKNFLLYCIKNYYISLLYMGYSREYLYTSAKKFFDNSTKEILSPTQISSFLNQFDFKNKNYEFLILMNTKSFDYMVGVMGISRGNMRIEKIQSTNSKEREKWCKDYCVKDLFKEYDKRHHQERAHENISIVKYEGLAIDPYSAANQFVENMRFLQTFIIYFKHFYAVNPVYKMIIKKEDGKYKYIKLPHRLQKRPYVQQELIDKRIANILEKKAMTNIALVSLARGIEMHAESLESKNYPALIRTFWTALETLFLNPLANSGRENVINSVSIIIQKTYLLKITRLIYAQIKETVTTKDLQNLGIDSYKSFLVYFSSHEADSEEMKKIYARLENNILLRSRLFSLRQSLKNGEKISEFLAKHEIRIGWQLKRIYRIRNIATHLGDDCTGLNIAINHLHNYFDYIVNYMLCKSENGDTIEDISTIVLEAKNDNQIHREMLKSKEPLSENNYIKYFFGPDAQLINYQFEY